MLLTHNNAYHAAVLQVYRAARHRVQLSKAGFAPPMGALQAYTYARRIVRVPVQPRTQAVATALRWYGHYRTTGVSPRACWQHAWRRARQVTNGYTQ